MKLTLCTVVGEARRESALIPSKVDLKRPGFVPGWLTLNGCGLGCSFHVIICGSGPM